MLVIRLARQGRHKYPTYRVVAAEKARAANGKFVSVLGHYNPHTKEVVIKKDEILAYLKNGAQPSNTVIKLLQREKVQLPDWAVLKTKKKAPKKVEVAPAEVKTEVAKEGAAEATATEATGAEAAAENAEAVAANATDPNVTETAAADAAEVTKAAKTEAAAAEIAADTPDTETPTA